MNQQPRNILFFTGTGTDVGKTFVAELAIKTLVNAGVRVGAYKPIASGCEPRDGQLYCEDADRLWKATGKLESIQHVCPQRFQAPLAPPTAATSENRSVDRQQLSDGAHYWFNRCELLVVEGAGGLFSPLAEEMTNADLAASIGATLVIVAANRTGVLHEITATCLAAKAVHGGMPIAGIILNHVDSDSQDQAIATNPKDIQRYCPAPLIGVIEHHGDGTPLTSWLRRTR